MKIPPSMKEKALGAVGIVIALVAVAVSTWFLYAERAWNMSYKKYSAAVKLNRDNDALVSRRDYWSKRYRSECDKMPVFTKAEKLDTYWLDKIETLARDNNVYLENRESKEEGTTGEVFEQFIDFKKWEAGFEQIVRFLYAVETEKDLMCKIEKIDIRADRRKGWLRGSMHLKCAYMRDDRRAKKAAAELESDEAAEEKGISAEEAE